jgi:hypothetical protein
MILSRNVAGRLLIDNEFICQRRSIRGVGTGILPIVNRGEHAPALESDIADAILLAERIMARIVRKEALNRISERWLGREPELYIRNQRAG